jgi:tetratricopeptide (TPR) repeat protein
MAKRKPDRRQPTRQASPPISIPDRRLVEKQMAQIHRLLESREFASLDEANAFLQEALTTGNLPTIEPQTPLEEAQELVYQASEATGKRRTQLARKALEISPDCADAYVLLAEQCRTPEEARPLYEAGIQAGERAVGPELFKEGIGEFWGILETRPYMRAREGLAEVLWATGERQAAIDHAADMLRLNPNDNQGMRYMLANWYVAVGADEELGRLLKQYKDEASAAWLYTKALWTFRREGDSRRARTALHEALEVNPFVVLYLSGAKVPQQMPEFYGMGDENEAIIYVAEAAEAWISTPDAIEWFVNTLLQEAATQNPEVFRTLLEEQPPGL